VDLMPRGFAKAADLSAPLEGEALQIAQANKAATGHSRGAPAIVPTVQLFNEILMRISEGQTLKEVCDGQRKKVRLLFDEHGDPVIDEQGKRMYEVIEGTDPIGVSMRTVYRWLKQYPDFWQAYSRARSLQADSLVDEAVSAAREAYDRDSAMVARVISDTNLKVASRLNPQKWGEKGDLSGGVQITINTNLELPAIEEVEGEGYSITIPQDVDLELTKSDGEDSFGLPKDE